MYTEDDDLDDALCPWCIADGSAHQKFKAEFFDAEGFPDGAPAGSIGTVLTRTPGFNTWQDGVEWPVCCNDLMAFLGPIGIDEIRTRTYYTLEGQLMTHIVHDMGISGGAATRLLQSLHKERGPTAYAFRCLSCETMAARIDGP